MAAKSGAPSSKTRASPASRPSPNRFKGVRMRSWGKWVSEIRLPNTRARLWLGSFATAEQAARAFDVAVVCLRGRSATLNFPDSPPVYAPLGLPHHQIQELATAAAAAAADFSASALPSDSSHSELETSSQSEPSTSELAQSSLMSSQSEPAMTPDVVECLSMCRQSEPAAMTAEVIACSSPMSEASLSISSSSNCVSTDSPSNSSSSSADDVEAACSSSWQEMDSLEGFLRLDGDVEQECLQAAAGQWALSNMGFQWDELLWGPPLSPYSACGQQFSVFPLLPPEDDMAILVEPSLWNLY